jgi:phosphoribosylaminoimidazole-succinocarboxamide synthase
MLKSLKEEEERMMKRVHYSDFKFNKEINMIQDKPILYEGSVKNIRGNFGSSPYIFEYSDRYSIFDWGGMPDLIKGKGESLATMAWEFFKYLENGKNFVFLKNNPLISKLGLEKTLKKLIEQGMKHHALGLMDESGEIANNSKSNYLAVRPVDVIRPKSEFAAGKLVYNYDAYTNKPLSTLVPLEVIFRFGLPSGSSLLKRLKNSNYCLENGINPKLKENDFFEEPILEFSTKLESTDRYLSLVEARLISAMTEGEFKKLLNLTRVLSLQLKNMFEKQEIKLWDGKFEFAFAATLDEEGDREFILVDSIGPDELRLTYEGVQLSKENLRQVYRETSWYQAVEKAKKIASDRGEENWKNICLNELMEKPKGLEAKKLSSIESMYKTLANSICLINGRSKVFTEAKDLKEIIKEFKH